MKKKYLILSLICIFVLFLSACTSATIGTGSIKSDPDNEDKLITVGFSQLGAESDWRSANSKSMREALSEENGFNLIFEDGQQKQSNQIMAIRTFIQQEVDYIVLAPVTETGWDTVLQEAKDAGIPVIIVDRMVDVSDDSLFMCFVGSDFRLEGEKVTAWMNEFFTKKGIEPRSVRIVSIQGNIGATAQIDRSAGLSDAVKKYNWRLLSRAPGDFTQAMGKEVMAEFLAKYDDLNVVYCENDNMALGAIEAIEAAGKKTGSDIENGEIMVVSFDGVNEEALKYVISDKISCIGECNPLHGPRISDIIMQLEQGKTPSKIQYVDEMIYAHDGTVPKIILDKHGYEVIDSKIISEKNVYEVIEMTNDIIYNKRLEFGN